MKLSLCHQSQMVLRAKKIRQSGVDNASGDVAACRDQRWILSGAVHSRDFSCRQVLFLKLRYK